MTIGRPLLNLKWFLWFCLMGGLVSPNFVLGEELVYANENWPPWIIIQKDSTTGKKTFSGIDVDIIKELGKRLNVKTKFKECPWERCLFMLKEGQVDLTSATLRRPDREVFLHFIEPPYDPTTKRALFLPKGKGASIQNYEDLYTLGKIGVVMGYQYFSQFDKDSKLKKFSVTRSVQLPEMLVSGRIDAFISEVTLAHDLIASMGYQNQIEKSGFEHESPLGYVALSKRSSFVQKLPQINEIMKKLRNEGQADVVLKKYLE